MVKRAIIQLSGPNPKIRISRPGVDVDSASELDFLLHENFIFAQPYFFTFVPCPITSVPSGSPTWATVPVTIPDVGETNPVPIIYSRISSTYHCFPTRRRSEGRTGAGSSYNFDISFHIVSPTRIDVKFYVSNNTNTTPDGTYLVVYRSGAPFIT